MKIKSRCSWSDAYRNAEYVKIKKALTHFCKLYNEDEIQVIINLTRISESEFAITFPCDIEFDMLCYCVNFLEYPSNFKWNAEVLGWSTTKSTDTWITGETSNKKVMLYVPENDDEGDNVSLITDDNIGYKLDFGSGEEKLSAELIERTFISPSIDINDLAVKQSAPLSIK